MRDINRMRGVLDAVLAEWERQPDTRLGQLLVNVAGGDPFYLEDDELVRRLRTKGAPWAWETGTPRERADMVRSTLPHVNDDTQRLCELFGLTEDGARRILAGEDWRAEHTA